jgi:uncharacterized protein
MSAGLTGTLTALFSGSLVGFTLGLIGGGGSILATPLLIYVVGVASPHVALGTSALAVAVNAYANLISHARKGHVRWRCAAVFAGMGVIGAFGGSSLGKMVDGQKLLFLFGLLMMVVAAAMLRGRRKTPTSDAPVEPPHVCLRTSFVAIGTGMLSGFFGIGGGFLIVPGLMFATGMPMINAVGSSLLAVGTFGLTTAANYAVSGLVDWTIAFEFIAGGILGGVIGMLAASRLSTKGQTLTNIFAGIIVVVGIYILARSGMALWG